MKSSMKLIIVAAVLMLALAASPAAARTGSIKTIDIGDHIFVYEIGLDIQSLQNGGGAVTALRKFVDDNVELAIIKEIPVANDASFDVLSGLVGDQTGLYYAVNGNEVAPQKADPAAFITIQKTDVSLGVYLNVTSGQHVDSIDGKSITRENKIAFKISAPNLGTYYKVGTVNASQVDIRITPPDGGEITVFGKNNVNLGKVNITKAELYTDTLDGTTAGENNTYIDLTDMTAGTYTAVAKFSAGQDFYKQAGTNSNAVTFTVLSKPITLTTNKESVVRGNNFAVTITGESNKVYLLYIKDASVASSAMPMIQGWEVNAQPGVSKNNGTAGYINIGQAGVDNTSVCAKSGVELKGCSGGAPAAGQYAGVLTQADGTRAVIWNTTSTTSDKKYTIKVVDPLDTSKYDQVDVTVEKGKMTITYEGTGSYYLGETIKLSGTNTDSKKVYLFIKGPNLGDNGRALSNLSQTTYTDCAGAAAAGKAPTATSCWKVVEVNTDNTWSYKWDTSKLTEIPGISFSLDAGTYTIYAVGVPADGTTEGLSATIEKVYETASVVLKKPFVTASTSTNTLAKGDKLYIRGTAEGKPNNIYVWIFGKNYRSCSNGESVKSDATYEFKLDRSATSSLYPGQYFVVVQHPMMNGVPDVVGTDSAGLDEVSGPTCSAASANTSTTWTNGAPVVQLVGLQASDAATALVDMLNSPNVDDTYTKLSFMIEEPWIRIDTIGDKYVGDTFKITGTTNLAEGDTILMTVTSSSFQPTEKTQTGEFSGSSGSVTVQKGDTYNTFSFDVDASTYKPDEYLVKAEAVEPAQTTTATFNVLEGKPTTVPTTERPTLTLPETPIRTTVPPTTVVPTTTAKPQPGFGALVALVGLGAVALLVLRRR